MSVAGYWWFISKLAWQEARSELVKAIAKFLAIAVIIGLVIHLGATAIGIDRIAVAAALPLAALFSFGAKLLVIPARLYDHRVTVAEAREFAVALEHQHGIGEALRLEGGRGQRAPLDEAELSWPKKCRLWFRETDRILREYDESEAFMFRTVEAEAGPRSDPFWDKKAIEAALLAKRLNKLRLIIGRAYERAGEHPDKR